MRGQGNWSNARQDQTLAFVIHVPWLSVQVNADGHPKMHPKLVPSARTKSGSPILRSTRDSAVLLKPIAKLSTRNVNSLRTKAKLLKEKINASEAAPQREPVRRVTPHSGMPQATPTRRAAQKRIQSQSEVPSAVDLPF